MHREERLLKISTFNVKNIETNKQHILKLLRTADLVCLQETWLFNFQLKMLDKLHRNFEGSGKAVDDDDPLPPVQKPRGYGGVATLYRTNMDLKTRKCLDEGCRVVDTEVLSEPPLVVINVYLPSRNTGNADLYDQILSEIQEILNK